MTYDFVVSNDHGEQLLDLRSLEVALHGNFPKPISHRYELVQYETGMILDRGALGNAARSVASVSVLKYVRGKEMHLQEGIVPLDSLASHAIWIYAAAGIDGNAALGFTRSLRRELW